MKVLVVGSGGREHAIVDALARSSHKPQLFAAPGNGGMEQTATCVPIAGDQISALVEFATRNRIDLTFVGPEVPLSLGIADRFREAGLPIVGPSQRLAQLESSKSFTKHVCRDAGIPTAAFREYTDALEAHRYVDSCALPVVIKADGLAAGKGVTVAETRESAHDAIAAMMQNAMFGAAGQRVVIEEFLEGEEASLLAFADGTCCKPMVPAQDHKRRFDGDRGPNTGGMGAYSTDTILTPQQRNAAIQQILMPTLEHVREYSGVLYAGLMLTGAGPKLIEYNARFGDPETQVILPRLRTDLLDVLIAITSHHLESVQLEWSADAAATVVLVSEGYPGKVQTGQRIRGLEQAAAIDGVRIFHAATVQRDGVFYASGGRVLNVTACGATLGQALERAYAAAAVIDFDGKDFRRDIGKRGLKQT